jgi:hypothetical protein
MLRFNWQLPKPYYIRSSIVPSRMREIERVRLRHNLRRQRSRWPFIFTSRCPAFHSRVNPTLKFGQVSGSCLASRSVHPFSPQAIYSPQGAGSVTTSVLRSFQPTLDSRIHGAIACSPATRGSPWFVSRALSSGCRNHPCLGLRCHCGAQLRCVICGVFGRGYVRGSVRDA